MKNIQNVYSKETVGSLTTDRVETSAKVVLQRTLCKSVSCKGIGLHSGLDMSLTIRPAIANAGISFKRIDVKHGLIPANWEYVVDTRMCTVLGNEQGVRVGTVEHLMAALAGCGVDNAVIEINGPEIPIMDGSSMAFVEMIKSVGVVELDKPRRVLRILKDIDIQNGDCRVSLKPSDRPKFGVEILYGDSVVSYQSITLEVVNGAFCKELAQARTFGFLQEVEALRAAGLALGGSLDNSIVVDTENGRVLNEGGLRQNDEFVRHKVLDAIGDLYLAGGFIMAKFEGFRSGHSLNHQLLRALFAEPDAWMWDTSADWEAEIAVDGGITAVNAST